MTPEERAITTLKNLRQTLQGYGDHHLAKNPPQVDKARVNYDAVAEINETLIVLGEDVRNPDILDLQPANTLQAELTTALEGMVADPREFARKLTRRLER